MDVFCLFVIFYDDKYSNWLFMDDDDDCGCNRKIKLFLHNGFIPFLRPVLYCYNATQYDSATMYYLKKKTSLVTFVRFVSVFVILLVTVIASRPYCFYPDKCIFFVLLSNFILIQVIFRNVFFPSCIFLWKQFYERICSIFKLSTKRHCRHMKHQVPFKLIIVLNGNSFCKMHW